MSSLPRPFLLFALAAAALFTGRGFAQKGSRPASLGGSKRFLTALSTDKPLYRPDETVWVRGVLLDAFADSLYRDNLRAAPQYAAPTFASPDDAFAIIGASVELVSRSLRTGRPADVLALEPVITRLMLGALYRA